MKIKQVEKELLEKPKVWLVTGAAGFIGSNLTQRLLELGQTVIGLDNFLTGLKHNIDDIRQSILSSDKAENIEKFRFVEGDICNYKLCLELTKSCDYVLHQAALGSVPRSMNVPLDSHRNNVDGFINVLNASKENGVEKMVYASSSSVYGDKEELPKIESEVGNPLSPYAATKKVNEIYSMAFAKSYGFPSVGLRYFNVFGRRQTPEGAYAAVMPKWINSILKGDEVSIFGDGETSRDFCYIKNVVQANILAATQGAASNSGKAYNVACGEKTSLNELYKELFLLIKEQKPDVKEIPVQYEDFRPGDIRHSLADISNLQNDVGYQPEYRLGEGLKDCIKWYIDFLK